MPTGFIAKMFSKKGIGFIMPSDGGPDVFFHCSSVADEQFDQLAEGQSVSYELEPTEEPNDGPRAATVAPTDKIPTGRTAEPNPPVARHPKARRRKPSWRK